jgi:hypothetical protein
MIIINFLDDHICADGTFKTNWQKFPLLIPGTTDMSKQFHPFGLMITKFQATEDWEWMFRTVKTLSEEINEIKYEPTILVADCASEITNGFTKVFTLAKRIYCWFHVKKLMDKKLKKIKNKTTRQSITLDIVNFQRNVTESMFIEAAKLMLNKWRLFNDPDVNYFIENNFMKWLNPKRMGWFDHYCDWVPITNNALESTNRYIKQHGTFRQRMGITQFIALLETGFL